MFYLATPTKLRFLHTRTPFSLLMPLSLTYNPSCFALLDLCLLAVDLVVLLRVVLLSLTL